MKRLIYIGNQLEKHGAAPTSADILPDLLKKEGFSVVTASSKKNKFVRLMHMCLTLIRYGKKNDLVLIDTYSTSSFWFAVSCAKICHLLHVPYIPLLHGGNLICRLQRNKGASSNFFDKAYKTVAPSRYMYQVFKRYDYHNLTYIPNALPLKNYRFQEKELQPKLLWVRAFAGIYNPILALKICQELQKVLPEVELCMVGPEKDGSLEDCRDYAKKHKLPVRFTGKLPKEEWIDLASHYSIFLNTSEVDNAPVSVIEAMALGLPVVSTDVGGMPFLIEDLKTGYLVERNNEVQAAEKIKFIVENPDEVLWTIRNARKKVEELDWEIVKQKWFKLLS